MFCTNCGNKTNIGDNFCGNCGKAIKHISVSEVERSSPKIESKPIPPIYKEPEYVPPTVQPSRRNSQSDAKAEKKKEEHKEELRKILEKEQGREITDRELFEADLWLTNYAKLMYDCAQTEFQSLGLHIKIPKKF